ncbi:hypothetical protein N7495_000151 [Penicillium taxi]|uniref:uncharacterized protein n=1 Tax=Penicillium taxi TaxID=168475 RepID=UPI0025453B27|nr:uncharacterized protein N7495_000151 [Penicillium taxi]KAJ5907469.1 hypothetical protein N7495_000151 [Penicillium taxi]
MSSITVASIPRITREALAEKLNSGTPSQELAIVDVRDSDHIGGNIVTSIWAPSEQLDARVPELVLNLKDRKTVVFHCMLSQQRGPSAALKYARARASKYPDVYSDQTIYILEGGFLQWGQKYGKDSSLTVGFVEDIWDEY